MDTIHLENFRNFRLPEAIDISPLTILVGENSSGKTSLLSAYKVVSELVSGGPANFNQGPFKLGSFDQIAHNHGGKIGRAKVFEIGITKDVRVQLQSDEKRQRYKLVLNYVFESGTSEPKIKELSVAFADASLVLKISGKGVLVRVNRHKKKYEFDFLGDEFPVFIGHQERGMQFNFLLTEMYFLARYGARSGPKRSKGRIPKWVQNILLDLHNIVVTASSTHKPVIAGAPIRTHPQRTYNPVEESVDPQGSHIPMLMARISYEKTREWVALQESLGEFGIKSGLFKKIQIRRLGKTGGDPFEVKIKTFGPPTNLIDVGYGVSQVLPVVVDCLSAKSPQNFLLQQPEVHLHPKAQAALGSFFVEMVAERQHSFIIETHSDHLVDRIRTCVRDNLIPREKFSILYFDRSGSETEIHSIKVDKLGNLVGAPSSYRRFFLEEERSFLGLD